MTPSDANSDVVGVSDGVKDSCDVFGHIENELNIVNHPLPKYVRDYSNFNDASNITPLNYMNNIITNKSLNVIMEFWNVILKIVNAIIISVIVIK